MVSNLFQTNKSQLIIYTPIILVFLNLILKVSYISSNSLGGDEPFSVYHAQLPVTSIIELLSAGNNPPLYEVLLHFWIKLFGISELSVRFPSLLLSALTVVFVYKIGKQFFTYPIALTASLVFTFSNLHLSLAHEARVYCLFAFLSTLSMYSFLVLCNKKQTALYSYLILLLVNTLLIYAHYFGFFILIIQSISMLFLSELRKKLMPNYLLYLLGLAIVYLPNVKILMVQFYQSSSNGTWVLPPMGLESVYNMLWQFCNKPFTTLFVIVILLLSFAQFLKRHDFKRVSTNAQIILIWFLFPFLFMFIISYWIPMFLDRYLIFVSVGFYLLVALSAAYLIQTTQFKLIIPSILVLLFLVTFNPNIDNKRHTKETIEKVVSLKDNRTKVVICPYEFMPNFAYYYDPTIFKETDDRKPYHLLAEKLIAQQIYAVYSITDVHIHDSDRVIFLDAASNFSYPENHILKTLEQTHTLVNTYPFYEIFKVYEFERKN